MHISNVNSSEPKCRQNINLCHAGGQFTFKKKERERERKKKEKRERTEKKKKESIPKAAFKRPGSKTSFNIKI